MKFLARFTHLLLIYFLLSVHLLAQDTLRIMTYNLLKYPDHASTRNEHFARVIESINPDIIVCPEMKSQSGVNQFLSSNLNNEYTAYPFQDENGFDTDNALFYKDSLIKVVNYRGITASPRKISEYTFVHRTTSDTLIVFGVHLKASQGSDNEALRNDSAMRVRFFTDKYNPGTNFMVLGDFNIYTSAEAAFQKFLVQEKGNSGHFLDPIDEPGNWHNNSSFRHIFTQSTRAENLGDGGATGGMDDRFDMILISESLMDSSGIYYIPDSYTAYGNDGKHFNNSINVQPNNAVSVDVANSLYRASDHLPVYADFVFGIVTGVDYLVKQPTMFKLHQNYPNPFNPSTIIKYSIPETRALYADNNPQHQESSIQNQVSVSIKVYDILGREVAILVNEMLRPGEYHVKFNADGLSSGVYFYQLRAGQFSKSKKMMLIR